MSGAGITGSAGEGAAMDGRIALTQRKLDLTQQEAEARLTALDSFSGKISGAMEKAAARRATAQRALETLALEQRMAQEEMRLTLTNALTQMEGMQSEWDAAVDSNAAELKAIKQAASDASVSQADKMSRLAKVRDELAKQSGTIDELADERVLLADEEAKLRARSVQLRQRRLQKLQGRVTPLPLPLPNVDLPISTDEIEKLGAAGGEVAGMAAEASKKAAEGLMKSLFGKQWEKLPDSTSGTPIEDMQRDKKKKDDGTTPQ